MPRLRGGALVEWPSMLFLDNRGLKLRRAFAFLNTGLKHIDSISMMLIFNSACMDAPR